MHIGLERNINEKDKVIAIDDEDEPMHTNVKDEVIVVDDDDTESVIKNNGNSAGLEYLQMMHV